MTESGTLLVVDDSQASLKVLTHILAAEGHVVRVADSGELGLASVTANPPELVLLDLRLPGMDGFEVLRQLKARERSRDIPVMLISASTDAAERAQGLRLGAVDFVSKPFQREELLARVHTHLELSRLRAGLTQRSFDLEQVNQQLQREMAERRRAEDAARASEAHLRAMFELASVGMAQADPATGRWVRVNQKMCAITGYPADELLELQIPEITHPEDREADREAFQRVVRGEAPSYRMEKRYLRKDGTETWVNVNMTVIRDASGQPVRTMATIEDITERKRIEADRERLIGELREAMANVKVLSGLIPICSSCKKVRDDTGYWTQVEVYVRDRSEAEFSHGICPECAAKMFPGVKRSMT